MPVFRYRTLGHTIVSSLVLRLPEETTADAQANLPPPMSTLGLERGSHAGDSTAWNSDATVLSSSHEGQAATVQLHDRGRQASVLFSASGQQLQLDIDADARTIRYQCPADVRDETIAAVIEGPGIGLYLRLQGTPLLHAAAVRWEDRGIALCAPSGFGKSTTATLLCKHGATPWSEDILALDTDLRSAFCDARQRRLLADTSEALALATPSEHPEIYEGASKQFRSAIPSLSPHLCQAQTLDEIVILAGRTHGSEAALQDIAGSKAVAALMAAQFPSWLRAPARQMQAMDAMASLAQHIRVRLLWMPNGLARADAATPALLRALSA